MTLPYQGQCQVSIRLSFKLYLHLVKGHDRLWNKASSTRKYYTLKSNSSQFFITCVHGSYTFLGRFIQDELSFFPHVAEYDACNSSRTAPTSLSVTLTCILRPHSAAIVSYMFLATVCRSAPPIHVQLVLILMN